MARRRSSGSRNQSARQANWWVKTWRPHWPGQAWVVLATVGLPGELGQGSSLAQLADDPEAKITQLCLGHRREVRSRIVEVDDGAPVRRGRGPFVGRNGRAGVQPFGVPDFPGLLRKFGEARQAGGLRGRGAVEDAGDAGHDVDLRADV